MLLEPINKAKRIENFDRQVQVRTQGYPITAHCCQPIRENDHGVLNSLKTLEAQITGTEQYSIGSVLVQQPADHTREAKIKRITKSIDEHFPIFERVPLKQRSTIPSDTKRQKTF